MKGIFFWLEGWHLDLFLRHSLDRARWLWRTSCAVFLPHPPKLGSSPERVCFPPRPLPVKPSSCPPSIFSGENSITTAVSSSTSARSVLLHPLHSYSSSSTAFPFAWFTTSLSVAALPWAPTLPTGSSSEFVEASIDVPISQLAPGSDPPRLFIDCNDAGIEFVEASIDVPISQLAQDGFQMKPFFEQLCQMPDHKGHCLYSSPLLCIQVTTFSDGGFTLGITHSHVVADGHSLWNFIVSWSECSRGVPLSLPPLHDRQKLALPDPSPEIASHWNFSLLDSDKEAADPAGGQEERKDSIGTKPSSNGNASSDGEPDPLVQCVLDMSASSVKKLKNEAGEGFTSYEVDHMCTFLAAHHSFSPKVKA
ncbi:hypothetical protein GOP47_0001161 [Adiantum capillus-veneris]|uniref:Uncharacterized protein n=1 Tax=Adiantum capillus-veneris TaxID=13818 RepID=A0A9D4VEV0_ADICA|nr:hypothetical protein GOP47_0001161 [Adiantum capillus-veneris]